MTKQKVLVTSALPYANGPIHLGHLAGAYLPADIFVRFCRLNGRDVLYIGGTDEHGVPITITADKTGQTPQQVVDHWHAHIAKSFKGAGISFDHFSRTSLPIHHETSQDFFLRIHDKGFLTKKSETQLYCPKCERFLPDRYVEGVCHHCGAEGAKGDQCEVCGKPIDPLKLIDPVCKLCGSTPQPRDTEHWYFRLDQFQGKIENWLATKGYWKENVLSFAKGMLADGLRERAVTRDMNWGIKVPLEGAEGKVLYVWFDAPIGYISSTREWAARQGKPELWKEYWWGRDTRLVHFIGKDNIFFHVLMFPAMLMAYGNYVLPENVPANEYLNLEGLKFSTSRNFAVWLHDYLEHFHPDPLRYYLCANMPENRDTDFNLREFQAHNNNELADSVGNFVNRTLTFVQRYFDGKVPERGDKNGEIGEIDADFIPKIDLTKASISEEIDHFHFRDAIDEFSAFARFCNKYFNDKAPWASRKDNPEDCATTINLCVQSVYALSVFMWPVMPFSAENLWGQLGLSTDWREHPWEQDYEEAIKPGHTLGEVKVLFPKIEDSQIEAEEKSFKGRAQAEEPKKSVSEVKPLAAPVDFGDFAKLDIRVALVTAAEPVPKSDKLLKLSLDLGPLGARTVAAGIARHYKPEDLVGRKVLVAANLKPRTLMGIESQGMVLAAVQQDTLALSGIDPAGDIPPGARVS